MVCYYSKIKLLITATILFSQFNLSGQEIARCIEVLGKDSLKFYFKSHGILVNKECSDYYRIAKMNPNYYLFDGPSKDYYSSGQLAVECSYINNSFNGIYKSFYSNGQVKELGEFREGIKIGEWKYWYENGQLKKLITFTDQDYFLKEFYRKNGKLLVSKGNGEFNDPDLLSSRSVSGEIKNGKQHGKWIIFNQLSRSITSEEFFDNGRFIEGQNIALVKSFNKKYFDYPHSLIDLTEDLLDLSYSKKIDCTQNGFQIPRYNSQYTSLSFYDYIYQNFDPLKFDHGFILAGLTINPLGKIINISMHSTLANKSVAEELNSVLSSSSKNWIPNTLKGTAIESSALFVFLFYNGTYKILGDSRNSYPNIEYSAQFNNGVDNLINLIENKTNLPKRFSEEGFNLATSISFHIDEAGNCFFDNSVFTCRIDVTDDERTLHNELIEMFKKTNGQWKPATYNSTPIKHYFNGVFTIRNGKPKFRLLSNNWILK